MLKNIRRDNKNRLLYKNYEKNILLLKYILNNEYVSREVRLNTLVKLNILVKIVKKSKINNRCVYTGRGRSVLSLYKLSRITFRKLASNGLLYGVKKSSW